MKLRIGTRKSPLALAQAEEVKTLLTEARPGLETEIIPMSTTGDQYMRGPLSEVGNKGLFTKELEEALLDGRIDIAIHSAKDMQTVLPDGLTIGCMPQREDPRDVLIGPGMVSIDNIPKGARFASASLRRAAQMLMRRPDLVSVPVRGNVQTRLAKLEAGEFDVTMLARAGLNRLKIWDVPGAELSIDEFLPAVAQGALAIECREKDADIQELLTLIGDLDTETAVRCERGFLAALDGSCRTPIAGYATVENGQVHLRGLILKPDGSEHHRIEATDAASNAEILGFATGEALLARVGKDFLI